MSSYKGIDISSYQGYNIDFSAVRNSGIEICIVKATESTMYTNMYFVLAELIAKNLDDASTDEEINNAVSGILPYAELMQKIGNRYAADIEKNKVRSDLGITYDLDVLRLIDAFRSYGLYVGSVCMTRFSGQPSAIAYQKKLESLEV